jgi:Cu(I)/Ag(I) efflux system membrane fusion protein
MAANGLPGSSAPPLTRWERFRLIVKVVELRLRFIALMAVTGAVFAYWDTIWNHIDKWRRPAAETAVAEAGLEFYCPMHPSVVMAQPGLCPICGMPLSKRAQGEPEALPPGVAARVSLSPQRIAQAGVRTVPVAYAPLVEEVVTVGTVELDERLVRRIASRLPGLTRIESLRVNVTGQTIRAGEVLGTLYSASLYQAAQELRLAARAQAARPSTVSGSLARQLSGDNSALLQASIEKLRLWGLTQEQIDALARSEVADPRIPIVAPIDGVVIRKAVVEGQYVGEGDPLFEVADLGHLWIKGRIYEHQLSLVQVGQEVEATVTAYPGEVFRGTVALIDPVLDAATRTVGVRFDLDNPDLRLRPGMYATVRLQTPVARTPAYLAARRGPAAEVDPLALTPAAQRVCLVTNLQLGAMGDPVAMEIEGRRVWLCCAGCEDKLRSDPALYLARLESAPRDQVLTIPESAVIDTGRRTLVYVEAEPGVFEARDVQLGPRSGDLYPVLDGLAVGERVAAAGAFLIDAETRLSAGGSAAYAEPAAGSLVHAH